MTSLGHLRSRQYKRRPPTLTLITQAEMVERIELARLEDAPVHCPTCGTTVHVEQSRVCYACKERKPMTAFARHKGDKALGREHRCKACKRVAMRPHDARRYREQKREQFRDVLGVSA